MQPSKNKAFILGSGITGLSIAYHLSKTHHVHILEKDDHIGGMAATFKKGDLVLDLGPHKIFSNLSKEMKEVLKIVGKDNLLKIKKRSQIRLLDRFIEFPVGPIDIFKVNPILGINMAFSYGLALLKKTISKSKETSYEDYLKNRFGNATYQLTFAPYAKKIWGNPKKLDKELASTRVAAPSLFEMVKQMIFKVKSKTTISANHFYYPKYGSGVIADKLAHHVKKNGGKLSVGVQITNVSLKGNRIHSITVDGTKHDLSPNDIVISTIPLKELCLVSPQVSKLISHHLPKLTNKNMILVYFLLNKGQISKQNWYFYPESKYIFNRVFEQKSFSSYMVPPSQTVLCCEVTTDPDSPLWADDDKKLIQQAKDQLIECGFFKQEEVLSTFTVRLENAYPIYSTGFRKVLNQIFNKLDDISNFYSIGRQGGFNYLGMIDCYDIGKKTAKYITKQSTFNNRTQLRDSFYNYIVID